MSASQSLPTPPELAQAPELALVAVLEYVLEITVRALLAAHPQLCDDERPYWIPQPPSSVIAEAIVSTVDALQRALDDYRRHIHMKGNPSTPQDDEAPF